MRFARLAAQGVDPDAASALTIQTFAQPTETWLASLFAWLGFSSSLVWHFDGALGLGMVLEERHVEKMLTCLIWPTTALVPVIRTLFLRSHLASLPPQPRSPSLAPR